MNLNLMKKIFNKFQNNNNSNKNLLTNQIYISKTKNDLNYLFFL